ncbi:class I SAM-dependent methyltransferase [Lutimonas zeaxanthinifaciens]|uniref:class I SAM-dependent methyltransferase n=1 Tax=Lutimonas zeaxanthinifaciens TaxID=3060215 RepID=UPI00265CF548|nr:class I SAM-dependent methyltransferase [Lutimonas sp. YSD2104]WKK65254.1 class I SAM-dependent methyltransferase [Lutimonas sp. YSD2104]
MGQFKEKEQYWNKVYNEKPLESVGWYQRVPNESLNLIQATELDKSAKIIDVGGGDSLLADHLLLNGFKNITVLDISEKAIERAQKRLGPLSAKIKWICTDIRVFKPSETYTIWHDRACLHFLTDDEDVELYRKVATSAVDSGGNLILGTFSKTGPLKCSGLPIRQYDAHALNNLFSNDFSRFHDFETIHVTPSGSIQNYVFCTFEKLSK